MLTQLGKILRSASVIMMTQQPSGIESKEGHANFVTEADKKTQEYLQRELAALLPASTLFGEEKDNEPLTNRATWVVDPIDGTLNYIHGLKHSAISVALSENKEIQLAAVYNPYRDEMFTAQRGKGAYLNGLAIHCAGTLFDRALTFYGTSPYQPSLVNTTFRTVTKLMFSTADVRRFGSAILDLAYVACGRADIFFEFSLSPWDYAAGMLLVLEAGGIFTLMNQQNDELDFTHSAAVFASNPVCAADALKIIQSDYREWVQSQL